VCVGSLQPVAGDDRPRVYVGEIAKPIAQRWSEHLDGACHDSGNPRFSRV
jgi:hypothetical protein